MKKTKPNVISKNKKFSIQELDGNYALVLTNPVNLGATVHITCSDEKELSTKAVEQNQIVFSLPGLIEITSVEIIEKSEASKDFYVVMTVGGITHESANDDLVEALLSLPKVKINAKVLFSVYHKEKLAKTSVLFPLETRRIITNRVSAVLFANKIKVLLK